MTRDPLQGSAVKRDFPLLAVHHPELVYLDSAATSQKPRAVIDGVSSFYETTNANVARGVYRLAERATNEMEAARAKVARFIAAPSPDEVVFTKNATESLNLVVQSWGRANLSAGDVVLLTQMEHHANIVPWQILAADLGLTIRWIPVTDDGRLDLGDLDTLLDGVRAVGFERDVQRPRHDQPGPRDHRSGPRRRRNGVGGRLPVRAPRADRCGGDGRRFHRLLRAQDVRPDRHRGAVGPPRAARRHAAVPGWRRNDRTGHPRGLHQRAPPHKFEAGTPPIAEAVGLGVAVDYLDALGMDAVRAHEIALTEYAFAALDKRFGDHLVIHGPRDATQRGGVLSLALGEVHPHDISQILDEHNVCVRAGHHCAKPLMKVLGVGATARASVYLYNDESDVDALVEALAAADEFFTF